jgi:hypothetical protein
MNRRCFLAKSAVASGIAVGMSLEEKTLLAKAAEEPPISSSQRPAKDFPMGKIGDVEISRVLCGGNLISGYAHSRDLMYVSDLLRNYFTEEKVFETLEICEQNGINTVVSHLPNLAESPNDARSLRIINKYRNERGGQMQFIGQCVPQPETIESNLQVAIDSGAVGIFLMGGVGDAWVQQGRLDLIGKVVDFIKQNGLIAGVGAHSLQVPIACEREGIDPDFYVKTFHHDNYWSATPKEKRVDFNVDSGSEYDHDNIWCINPEETTKVMATIDKPWIAYKTLAAGAIHPSDGLEWVFKHGADFALLGMFDFQVTEDAIIAKKVLAKDEIKGRARPWRA